MSTKYRILEVGETTVSGDEVKAGSKWLLLKSFGVVYQYGAGLYRRPVVDCPPVLSRENEIMKRIRDLESTIEDIKTVMSTLAKSSQPKCAKCGGTGSVDVGAPNHWVDCHSCNGRGF